jgi:hypothetical protein
MITPEAVQVPAGTQTCNDGGQVIVGAGGLTTTSKVQVAVPPSLVAVQVTFVVPTGKTEPELTLTGLPPGPRGAVQVKVGVGVPVTPSAGKVTAAEHWPAAAVTVTGAVGQEPKAGPMTVIHGRTVMCTVSVTVVPLHVSW